jgi:hypothetical protein
VSTEHTVSVVWSCARILIVLVRLLRLARNPHAEPNPTAWCDVFDMHDPTAWSVKIERTVAWTAANCQCNSNNRVQAQREANRSKWQYAGYRGRRRFDSLESRPCSASVPKRTFVPPHSSTLVSRIQPVETHVACDSSLFSFPDLSLAFPFNVDGLMGFAHGNEGKSPCCMIRVGVVCVFSCWAHMHVQYWSAPVLLSPGHAPTCGQGYMQLPILPGMGQRNP